MRIVIIGVFLFLINCSAPEGKLFMHVDMASLHDEGMFKPENGDKLSIVGDFNNWEVNKHLLADDEGDWIYTININELPIDLDEELSFKFVVSSEKENKLTNMGWERITNRSITADEIKKEQPVFIFNEPWSPLVADTLSFRVNMSNQNVLGFFKPEMGDKVAVSGSFNDWDKTGIQLESTSDLLVYELTLPVEVRKHEPLIYKYQIISGVNREEELVMTNQGREFTDNRLYSENNSSDYFNNQKRVLRVVLTEEWLEQQNYSLKQDDVLHLKLMWNGNQSQNYRLEPDAKGAYETALQIPESAADVKGAVIVNFHEEIYNMEHLLVNQKGTLIYVT